MEAARPKSARLRTDRRKWQLFIRTVFSISRTPPIRRVASLARGQCLAPGLRVNQYYLSQEGFASIGGAIRAPAGTGDTLYLCFQYPLLLSTGSVSYTHLTLPTSD